MSARSRTPRAPAEDAAEDTDSGEETPARRGRPRSEERRLAILQAARELLGEVGLRQVTADAIAQRANVSKATLYKWWPNKSLVALDAFLHDMEAEVDVPDTGSVAEDFRLQLRSAMRFYTGPGGRLFTQFVAEAQSDPELSRAFLDRFLLRRRDAVRVIWRRGVERGELRAGLDDDLVLDAIYGPMIFRLLTGHAPLSPKVADAMVDAAVNGLLARQPKSPRPSSRVATQRA